MSDLPRKRTLAGAIGMSALGYVVAAAMVGRGHVSGLFVRQ